MFDSKIVTKVLIDIRKRNNMTQEVLSGLADLDRTHYSKIERGLRVPTLETIFKIANAVNVPAYEIIKEIEEEMKKDSL